MVKRIEQRKEIKKSNDEELRSLISAGKEQLREQRFKDKFSRKAGFIRQTKRQIARAMTELRARTNATK